MAKKPAPPPPPPPPPEEEEQECPKCPPVGAPAWMATFADMATLLMAFFVLILSFAEFNQPRFKMIAGSLREAFGVQRLVPVMEAPEGQQIIEMNFSPSPQPSVTQEMTQQTTDRDREDTDVTEPQEVSENDQPDPTPEQQEMMEDLQEALDEMGSDLTVEMEGDQVTIKFPEGTADEPIEEVAEKMAQAAQAMEQAGATGNDVQVSGLSDVMGDLAEAIGANSDGQSGGDQAAANRRAEIAEAKMRVALQEQIDQGLVDVQREDDKVFITVGAGGAFSSGSADLTAQAREIMAGLALGAAGGDSQITVTGHTDNVPLSGGQFTDNWGLAAGRASSVVRELGASGLIDPSRLLAVSKGESEPVADNNTAAGREENRRIEIEINYSGE